MPHRTNDSATPRHPEIPLPVTVEGVRAFCDNLRRQSRNAGQTLAVVTGLQSFIATLAGAGLTVSPVYKAIMALLDEQASSVRLQVLEDNTAILVAAVRGKQRCGVAQAHGAVSRNGFHQAALAAIDRLTQQEQAAALGWAAQWRADATRRAEAASGYPGAVDLVAAGIAPAEYAAMNDLCLYLADAQA